MCFTTQYKQHRDKKRDREKRVESNLDYRVTYN